MSGNSGTVTRWKWRLTEDETMPHTKKHGHHGPRYAYYIQWLHKPKLCDCGAPATHITHGGGECDRCRELNAVQFRREDLKEVQPRWASIADEYRVHCEVSA
jgi:hypothetical protein